MKVAAVLSTVLVFWQASGASSLVSVPESLSMMLWGAMLLTIGSLLSGPKRTLAPAEVNTRKPMTDKTSSAGYAIRAA